MTVMFMKSWCWWLEVGDSFWMLVTEFWYRWRLLNGFEISKLSPTNSSQTSVTNIVDVTSMLSISHHMIRHECSLKIWLEKSRMLESLKLVSFDWAWKVSNLHFEVNYLWKSFQLSTVISNLTSSYIPSRKFPSPPFSNFAFQLCIVPVESGRTNTSNLYICKWIIIMSHQNT